MITLEKIAIIKEKLKVELDKEPLNSMRKGMKHVHDSGNHTTMLEGEGLKKFTGKFIDPATKKGPVHVESFKDGELREVLRMLLDQLQPNLRIYSGRPSTEISLRDV